MFKKGQKLVFIVKKSHPTMMIPKFQEIITCDGYSIIHPNSIYVQEYPKSPYGTIQCFAQGCFRPLDQWLKEQSETDIKEIEKTFPELVPACTEH